MSDASQRSHIPDEKLIDLTDKKLDELKEERADLEEQVASDGGARQARQALQNKERATDKLEQKREEMMDRDDN
ncbi:MAG: hypothetical protein H7Z40_07885 [Phycisphaerae bacterium]|nr:hypothetical protein [Gemmatimonadaceae bacterium]